MIYDVHSYTPGEGYPEAAAVTPAAVPPPAVEAVKAPGAEPASAVSAPEPEPEAAPAPAPVAAYALAMPEGIPLETVNEANAAALAEFSAVASASGIPKELAESLVDHYAQVQSTVFQYGVSEADDYSPESGRVHIERLWGANTDANIATVRKQAQALGPAFLAWCDLGYGNSPAVLVSLLHMADMKLDPPKAKAALDALMQTPEYRRGDQAAVLRAHALSKRAHKQSNP